jgi:hypothetical protein
MKKVDAIMLFIVSNLFSEHNALFNLKVNHNFFHDSAVQKMKQLLGNGRYLNLCNVNKYIYIYIYIYIQSGFPA